MRWKIEASDDPQFSRVVKLLWDQPTDSPSKPGIAIQSKQVQAERARYVRFTASKLAQRKDDYIFALAELRVLDRDGVNLAQGKSVTALDSIEAPVRWSRSNLVDDKYPRAADAQHKQVSDLEAERRAIWNAWCLLPFSSDRRTLQSS